MSESYPFASAFEQDLISLLVQNAGFYSRFADHMDDEAFPSNDARIVARGCRLHFNESHRGPGGASIVLQRLTRLHHDGKLSMDNLVVAADLLATIEERRMPDEHAVSHEFSAVLKRRLGAAVIEKGIVQFSNRGDMGEIARQIEVVESIGDVDLSIGDDLGSLAGDLTAGAQAERMSFGCEELDARTGGGAKRGEFGFFLAPPKTGKTLSLVQQSVISRKSGRNCLVVTLELPSDMWRARHLAGMTGTPTTEIVHHPMTTVAWERYEKLIDKMTQAGRRLGKLRVKKMKAGFTKLVDLLTSVDRVEQAWGEPVDCLVVDYMDRMRGSNDAWKMYEQMLEVYEGARLWAEEHQRWVVTASQAKGHVKAGDMPQLNDCADSQNKVRVTDWMAGIQKHISEDLIGQVSIQLLAGRNYPETEALGPYHGGSQFGVFFESVAVPGMDVKRALDKLTPEDLGGTPFE